MSLLHKLEFCCISKSTLFAAEKEVLVRKLQQDKANLKEEVDRLQEEIALHDRIAVTTSRKCP